ncbi:MAG TPA: PA14 domain-containing protein, partial [Paludibacter sp.]|nr:PA14 domain-containing protein [Paludibacter sp.]
MKRILFPLMLVLFAGSCVAAPVQTLSNGMRVSPKNGAAKTIEITVVNSHIVRVQAVPTREIPQKASLCVVPGADSGTSFKVTTSSKLATLSTGELTVKVTLDKGEVSFLDKSGKALLEEMPNGKSFKPFTAQNDHGYTMQQVFKGTQGEAIYGLGQHQSDDFNYKNKSEDLFQYNTKVSVPFIVSTGNYGILWDNYSQSKYGDSRDYADLNQFELYDKDGNKGSLTATYTQKNAPTIVRKETGIDYENLVTVKNFPANFNFNDGSIAWEGSFVPSKTDTYKFSLYYAGYTKVWINDSLVVPERWRTSWNPNTFRFKYDLVKDKKYKLKLEWKPDGGVSYIGLKALNVSDIEKNGNISFWSEMADKMDYYFVSGKDMDDVISGYRTLTGKASIMPRWAMGYWQSRERYKTQAELLDAVSQFR